MGGTSHSPLSTEPKPAPLISPPNTVALSAIITGCKVFAKRLDEPGPIKAEVLGIRPASIQRRSRFAKPVIKDEEPNSDGLEKEAAESLEFYLHWIGYNKRLDEWVVGSRVHLDQSIEWPVVNPTPSTSANSTATSPKQSGKQARKSSVVHKRESSKLRKVALKNAQKLTKKKQSHRLDQTPKNKQKKAKRGSEANGEEESSSQTKLGDSESMASEDEDDEDDEDPEQEEHDQEEEEEDEDEEDEDEDEDVDSDRTQNQFSKEDEIEKLRTSGSMTQSHHEISRVKNLDRIQIGKHEVEAWYFSPYPIEFAHIPILYICEFCLSFYGSEAQIHRHRMKCTLLHPPGNEIYRAEEIHFFEIDGRRQKTWCRNLSLLSKCFLDHKTLYYDVDPFLYYVMCQRDSNGLHLIGYFSKEKESAENYNVACILTLPQYQRLGFGKLLIEFSYELSKKEGKLGSPEKPLSDLGLLSYRAYWEETIVGFILDCHQKNEGVSIDEIAQKTAIVHSDVMHVCQTLQLLKYRNKQHIICLSDAIIERFEKTNKKNRRRIQPNQLIWKPPVFSRAQLQFGF
ncbi:Histone acetyltransferase [Puccinia graminis f. sp. tritici]|uniref:histone acetyltransferase n=1 Tax=Puccinia graminis f. sp. tritici TaxID=56615 RepID=A0A5B0S2X1_PUCGR|nr:Histone acetyltransferase [Puccinia graminis f. sp. tritici]KAA1131879.1 Histone acetyltransferase [Puccinia graminis f. sp. tritici]